jgi:Tfp pilus assembly protein PilP
VRNMSKSILVTALLAAALLPGRAVAQQEQQPQPQAQAQAQAGGQAANIELVYEREVFSYRGVSRRDPFRPLTDDDSMGPRFESLALQAIIYSTGRGNSLALLTDADGRVYRVRVGDVVGNSQVIEIGPLRVVLAVENFGTIRQEMLELPTRGGSDR